ncbi:flagellar protein FlgJ [Acetoanaerobium noterae]|jgi:flagellar protein FlgJ|uniref:Flagellar protein FlgJ n=1 Tax=Acetoanaerobium noterae TaxID=745369 RepID=A0A1T5DK45_9FIRM|nr:rod-binding protein [Acetoanaerobium noterae]MDK2804798.1 peptidoglycan hydrolase FlgJ [Peptostreptococcaceae bacterium]SKB71793.1 flagellar protein FlgJ [Acetoanaerobium noterae]
MDIKPFIPTNIPVSYKDEQMSEMEKEKLKKVAGEMEAEFLKIMLKQMKATIPENEDEEKAPGKDIMTDFMLERYAEDVSKNQSMGIAKMIYEQYTKTYKK